MYQALKFDEIDSLGQALRNSFEGKTDDDYVQRKNLEKRVESFYCIASLQTKTQKSHNPNYETLKFLLALR
jgi:hypothetical protein